jgi:NADH-quinone oxidoreductase subunit I
MWITRRMNELWSLAKGLGITGRFLFERTITVHYPRGEVSNLEGFRGPIALVPRPDDPEKPKCIACLMCMNICPSNCITVAKMKAPRPDPAQDQSRTADETQKKGQPAAPKLPQTYIYDYSLCSLCGLCADVCPVDSIIFSSEAYRVARDRNHLKMDLLEKLKQRARDASGETTH